MRASTELNSFLELEKLAHGKTEKAFCKLTFFDN